MTDEYFLQKLQCTTSWFMRFERFVKINVNMKLFLFWFWLLFWYLQLLQNTLIIKQTVALLWKTYKKCFCLIFIYMYIFKGFLFCFQICPLVYICLNQMLMLATIYVKKDAVCCFCIKTNWEINLLLGNYVVILLLSVHVGPIQATMLVSVLGDILDKVSLVIVPVSTKGQIISE